jgi:prepilin-type N-terminal cleavage/methylation domain-containing protein
MRKIRSSKKGFTLAELLIVVAIIGVLVGISIPIFTTQLAKSRLATNQANARAAKAAVLAAYLDDDSVTGGKYTVATGKIDTATATGGTAAPSTDIGSWTTANMGSTVYDEWIIVLDDGEVDSINYVAATSTTPDP